MTRPSLGRRLLAETVGTGLLVTVVVGSGIAAATADVVVPHGTTVPSENTTGRARR